MANKESLQDFIEFVGKLKGDEKGEAQLFCDRFFRAFGHGGVIEANGTLEARIKFSDSGRTKFADCLWSPPDHDGVLIEMKKRSEKNLESHFPQARDYWVQMNPEVVIGKGAQKPKYIILCNFDKFIIYQYLSLVDEIKIEDFIDRSSAFNFMLIGHKEPIFHNNVEKISQDAARDIGTIFNYLIHERNLERETVQRFLLQCVLSLFSEDFGLLPNSFFSELIQDCLRGNNSYDLMGGLFRQMASESPAKGGRFKDIKYFNGGLFDRVDPIELDETSLRYLDEVAKYNWKYVNPVIFGSLFESTMNAEERHQFGAHFTSEADILKIVSPTIITPWSEKTAKAKTLTDLSRLLDELENFRVLDPACGCGNFLYVAYRSLKNIEMQIIEKIVDNFSRRSFSSIKFGVSRVNTKQFYGLDVLQIAVEIAKVTMMLGKELAASEWNKRISPLVAILGFNIDTGLPLDRLESNIVRDDALFCEWPQFDVIIGNPPYQSKNKMAVEMDRTYINRVREKYPEVPGRADYCVYWFRRAHDEMKPGQRAGLVGTNTIRQNYSREGGLDYIVNNGGTITDAVSTQVWSGDAVVHVSIVNWVKGEEGGKKRLTFQRGDGTDSPYEYYEVDLINSSLSLAVDLTSAKPLDTNVSSGKCYQGQTHGHSGFLLTVEEAKNILSKDLKFKSVLRPFLTANELIGNFGSQPKRYVIDFRERDIFSAKSFDELYDRVKSTVFADKEQKAKAEEEKNQRAREVLARAKVNHDHANAFKNWWILFRPRNEMMTVISGIKRYIACGRVTKRPIFEFISSEISPNDALMVFPFEDDYSFGILQSTVHWEWFIAKCSTLKGDFRYTSNTVFDTFPWPQKVSAKHVELIAKYAFELREVRRKVMRDHGMTLRALYRDMEETPNNPVSLVQDKLDRAACAAYGMSRDEDILSFLLKLNLQLHEKEASGETIVGPGLPPGFDVHRFISLDCVSVS